MQSLDYPQVITCKKSCSACCHTEVAVTQDEAVLLAERATRDKAFNFGRLKAQNQAGAWYQKSYDTRACVFLGEDKSCMVYEDRPAVCRVNFVTSSADDCDTRDGRTKAQRLVMIEKAHYLMAKVFLASDKTGTLPELLEQELKKKQLQSLKITV